MILFTLGLLVASLKDYKTPCHVKSRLDGGKILPLQMYTASQLPRSPNPQPQSRLDAQDRASRPLSPDRHLHIIYADSHICVVHKPSGVLCVPGPRRNPSVANLAHDLLSPPDFDVDRMVVHRLDMDTSGIVIFALTEQALKQLHSDFRDRDRIKKTYQALLCGHLEVSEGEIDLPLERDPIRPPFMRISLPDRPLEVSRAHESFAKYLDKAPKPSLTEFRVLSREYLEGVPVTRVELYPKTGRTHQLRVHCAALGHSIIGDDIYGLGGDGSPDGGLMHEQRNVFWDRASRLHQEQLLHQRPNLCLHAEQLCIYHPFSRAPMSFRANPSF